MRNVLDENQNIFIKRIVHDSEYGVFGTPEQTRLALIAGGVFMTIMSFVLTVLNVVMGYWTMALTTLILVVGFGIAILLAYWKHLRAAKATIAIICAVTFSVYAVSGGNYGFAILWILLLPPAGMMLLGTRIGFILSLYFLLFLVTLFYTPLIPYADVYTSTFVMRFPILYLCDFGLAFILMNRLQRLYTTIDEQANTDALTGLGNRAATKTIADQIDNTERYPNVTVVYMDLNRLKWINDNVGHEAGDYALIEAANMIRKAFEGDYCFRIGGDEYFVVSTEGNVPEKLAALKKATTEWHDDKIPEISLSVGYASRKDNPNASYQELCRIADAYMYADKENYYKTSGHERRK